MGRTKQSAGLQPQAYRKNARAKHAKVTINKTIPALLASDARARNGVENVELIANPPRVTACLHTTTSNASDYSEAEQPSSKGYDNDSKLPSHHHLTGNYPKISIQAMDTITAAFCLSTERPLKTSKAGKVGILNMASPLRPGGGVLNGATSQEEFLCARTTLYPSLRERFYRLPDIGGVWTPDVLIFRSGDQDAKDLGKGERLHVGVVSAAMLRFPDIEEAEASYIKPRDREIVEMKMRAVLRIFQAQGVEKVVLGAWGCGAYGNPVKEVAKAWRKVLVKTSDRDVKGKRRDVTTEKETWDGIKEIIFAISDPNTAREFAHWFGVELTTTNGPMDSRVKEKNVVVGDAMVEELTLKIAELEARIPQARTAVLRTGLVEILGDLKRQLENRNGQCSSDKLDSHAESQ